MKFAIATLSLTALIFPAFGQNGLSLTAASLFGGSREDAGAGTAIDPQDGSIWFVGSTTSADFPVSQARQVRAKDAFISKFDVSGRRLLFSTRLGGSFDDAATAIVVDGQGNVYVTGTTESTDFPRAGYVVTQQVINPAKTAINFFVAKFDRAGRLLYSRQFGGSGHDYANAIAFGPFAAGGDAIYVSGRTYSHDFPVTQTALSNRLRGSSDAFVTAIQIPAGSPGTVVYSTYLGGDGNESSKGISVRRGDRGGVDVTLAGWTDSYNLPVTQGAWRGHYGGGQSDAFVTRFNLHNVVYIVAGPNPLASLVYSTFAGAEGEDAAAGLAVDGAGVTYVTGFTRSSGFPTTHGCYQPYYGGGASDAFLIKLLPSGAVVLSTFFGGHGTDSARAVVIDSFDHAFIAGNTNSTNLAASESAPQREAAQGADGFVAEFDGDGTSLLYATYLGGAGQDVLSAAAFDQRSRALVTAGWSNSKRTGDTDLLIAKFAVH